MIFRIIQLSAIMFLALVGCQSNPSSEPSQIPAEADHKKLSAEEIKAYGIELGGVETRILNQHITANGILDVPPQNLLSISAPLGGFVRATDLLQGMKVRKGDLLVEIEHPDYIQLQQDYLEGLSQLSLSESEFKRQELLLKENVNAVKTMEQAGSQLQSLRAKVQGLRAKLTMVHLSPDEIKNGIQPTIKLISPINGYVTEVNINIGKYASPTDPLVKLVNVEHIHAELQIFEKDISQVHENQHVYFRLTNDTVDREAEVYLIGKEISPERTIRVHCHLKKEDPKLIPGMYVTARILIGTLETEVLPETAVVQSGGENFVFIAEPEGVFRMVSVNAGSAQNGFRTVNFAAPPLRPIVVKGAYNLLSALKNMEE